MPGEVFELACVEPASWQCHCRCGLADRGLDLSEAMLNTARERAAAERVSIEYVLGERRKFDLLAAVVELAGRGVCRLVLVNPQHIKGLNGYKTDPKDAQWIADLLESDKLKGSWVPSRPIRERVIAPGASTKCTPCAL